jgi:decaprenyl-phosphate phosphoribosyltransferase
MNFSKLNLISLLALGSIHPYFQALRPKQWTKNLIVFAAPLFAFNIHASVFFNCLLAFLLFCFASSGFYLLNDVLDVESDCRHPIKCQRPIAAGLVPIPVAIGMALLLLASALIISWRYSTNLGLTVTSYAILQVAYNLRLKRTVILDVMAIAAGFVLRADGGAAAAHIGLSPWFLLCTAMLALFLGIEKRKAELRVLAAQKGKMRSVLKRYSLPLLLRMETTASTGAIITYALWSAGPQLNGASTQWMLVTLPFVLYGIFRYQLLSDRKETLRRMQGGNLQHLQQTERPEEVLLQDLPTLLTVIGWIITVFLVLLLKHQGLID